jgi:aminoglycoside phosphotransferase (APT) family kinase protein
MSADYREYLERRHGRFGTPRGVVFGMVARATGRRPVSRRKLALGNDNEVYVVGVESGEDYVVRIHRSGEVDLATEAWVIERCREAGAPAPRVHLVGHEEHEGARLEFMVQSRVAGKPLSDALRAMSEEERGSACRGAGEVLGRIHSVQVGGFYRRSPEGRWDFPDWRSVMESSIQGRGSEREWILKAGFTEDDFAEMIRLMERYRDEFGCPQPVLCHGDFLPEHVFVDDRGQVTGVIDFGGYEGGHPVHDFAVVTMAESAMELDQVLEGYPPSPFLSDRFGERLWLRRLTLGVGCRARHMQIGT